MLIILEGPDCVGKSTLASKFEAWLPWQAPLARRLKASPPGDVHPLDAYVAPLLDFGPNDLIICDRWHFGEVVYPIVMERPTKMTRWIFDYIELFLQSRGALTVVMHESTEELLRRYRERGDDYVSEAELAYSATVYRLNEHLLRTRHVSPADIQLTATLREQDVHHMRGSYTTWVGNALPDVLLMGDTRNCDGQTCKHKTRHHPAGPAFMPYPATSGEFLFRALNPLPADVAVANACDVDPPLELWQDLGEPAIVALGKQASARLDENSIPHATVPHPQYVRRFHHGACAEYGRLIKDLIGTERNELQWRPSRLSTVKTSTATSYAT